ncbi:MAG: hypothetical protein A3A80_02445 [Candidatus Terrybacteria bacterium RIFCSPLOWO2_01_FULL_44_24]|uniref:Fido domain-containing protein n=1 Tax=Candidatus Terrybacteria bacterium RIFCSPHIGHO2_01_FULL_43_35 TaxID=1802361 RepID=A0A1G2PEG1_9BACT|nr:MAG: hypothetical protein A2828_02240 [Candidatus Terrybacteria bacterium RIFCSPHIGHO2_01_FULL_43_35]OHA50312.1 MAG: hypothetical protein A3B75_00755 [Candidatus Terrybacteria bacterium RIFCSPHIGHO2_02_FULL_43_14]OHA50934.1 MAG: hypothetical protein A3A80_02445 [Candidatus Terrybacteria bacterium RIFCSPLOWO2_01_FULL_44_24]
MEDEQRHYDPKEVTESKIHEINFPEGLSEKDIELIVAQCKHQGATSSEQVKGFAEAYKEAKETAFDSERLESITAEEVRELILRFGELTENIKNKNGFRTVPARFKDFSFALPPDLIERAISNFSQAYAEGLLASEEYYLIFEEIHPMLDGNGRIGDLLWKIDVTRKTKHWPQELPPDVFGPK